MNSDVIRNPVWKLGTGYWLYLILLSALVAGVFFTPIKGMLTMWGGREEYGYAYMIPVISAFLVWQRKNLLANIDFKSSILGLVVIFLGGVLFAVGQIATTHTLSQYALVVTILGVAYALMGWRAFKIIAIPLLLLLFMVPLPPFIYNALSTKLQLISSQVGVAVIRLFDISVYLEGNVIDLGKYKLQVVEACSGLRYLFPLASLSFIAAYIYKAEFWKKAIIFFSSIPITVFMNSFRIGVIGVLVEYYGIEQADGFLHYFEGWIIFMACMAVLIFEMYLLGKVGKQRGTLSESFALDFPDALPDGPYSKRTLKFHQLIIILLIAGFLVPGYAVKNREPVEIVRQSFASFPQNFGEWTGKPDRLEQIYLDALKLDDYIITDYRNENGEMVNMYIAWYDDQAAGESAHSPKACIPGGGWLIKDHSIRTVDVPDQDIALNINRLLIKKGDYSQLVYYWFNQRGRNISNEYMVKWYLFWDSLTRNRTDGSLIRLTANIAPGQDISKADETLQKFLVDSLPMLNKYIPQ